MCIFEKLDDSALPACATNPILWAEGRASRPRKFKASDFCQDEHTMIDRFAAADGAVYLGAMVYKSGGRPDGSL